MKKTSFLVLLLATTFSLISFAQATQLVCVSEKEETLYFTDGLIQLTADIKNTTTLDNLSLVLSDSKMGGRESRVEGKATKKYVRFGLYGDHVCSYKLTLYKDFSTRKKTTAYLDAYCEENHNTSHELNCEIQ